MIDFRDGPIVILDPEVVHPTPEILGELVEAVVHGNEPTPARELSVATLEFPEGPVGPADADPSEGEAEKGGLIGRRHKALVLVDPKLEGTLKKALNALHHPPSRSPTFDQNDEIGGAAGKVVSAPFKLLIQIVQDDVGQQGR